MATPVYNAAWRSGGGYGQRGGWGSRGRTWGIVTGNGSMLGGNTPEYLGGGQPASEEAGFFGNGTPVYRSGPSTTITPNAAATTPGMTASEGTTQPPAPQPGQMAIIVPRT